MKYMGSKRAMLGNGLGELLGREVPKSRRFVDLFTGSATVSVHVACRFNVPSLAFDLQVYSAVLAGAVIHRQEALDPKAFFSSWKKRAGSFVKKLDVPDVPKVTIASVEACRKWCSAQSELPITKAYGGHYFSAYQAVWIDALCAKLPEQEPARTVALAAVIHAASQCAAAPGHTAQPFQPTKTSKRYLAEAWNRDVLQKAHNAFESIGILCARQQGRADVADANEAATRLEEGDLAFIDPPYSGVHYSRFYHVLETIAQGSCGDVSGIGRYPAPELRPRSKYSVGSESPGALDDLLETVASRGARAILTFPDHACSNGLSGTTVREIASKYFEVYETQVSSRFSTLGGTGDGRADEAGRAARQHAKEMMLVLNQK
jgi:adenine-specific DNA-methyltransferase